MFKGSLILLTHSREIQKANNTGRLVQQIIPICKTVIWQRTQPDDFLLQLIKSGKTALVYPVDETTSSADINDFDNFILIDSTWQEARKIFNRSPYLQSLPRVQLSVEHTSSYHLRRNQVEGGLCTAECVVELLRVRSCFDYADKLEGAYRSFLGV